MTAHKHAELMALYAKDASETDKPWERWEHRSDRVHSDGSWFGLNDHPSWNDEYKYRRKPQKKAVDLSLLIDSGIDCEISNNTYEWRIAKLLEIRINHEGVTHYNGYVKCRPRMNHWHFWQGGECPLPDGLWVDIDRRDGLGNRGYSTDYSWRHTGAGNDIIAFKVTELAEGYCWPWELDNG